MTSREYTKFKNSFIGPILPRSIAKKKSIGIYHDDKCKDTVVSDQTKPLSENDWRKTRFNHNIKQKLTPSWANKDKIKQIYNEAKLMTEKTGIKHHVDHVIPLRSYYVCGLHVENNLKIVTAKDNIQKSNAFNP
jgi:hypothetical protein